MQMRSLKIVELKKQGQMTFEVSRKMEELMGPLEHKLQDNIKK